MSTEPRHPESSTAPRPVDDGTSASLPELTLHERADLAEDRRRQRELDDGELGGEA